MIFRCEHILPSQQLFSRNGMFGSKLARVSSITVYDVNSLGNSIALHASPVSVATMNLKSMIQRSSNDVRVLNEAIEALSSIKRDPLPDNDARAHRRYAIDGSAMLCYEHDKIWIPIYVRDISERGIGFHHGTAIREGIAAISLKIPGHPITQLWVKIRWCSQIDQGMFLSGSEVMGVAHDILSPW